MTTTMPTRIFNFSAGPAVAAAAGARAGPARPGGAAGRRHVGDGDQPPLEDVRGHPAAPIADIRELAGVPASYKVLMLQGGASLQFSMVPMNLLGAGADGRLHRHRLVGRQGDQGGKRVGTVNVAGSTKADNYNRIPAPDELKLTPGAAYVHITTNNTIEGTEWHDAAGRGRRAAGRRRVVRHLQPADRRRPVRPRSTPARRRTSGRRASRW